MNEWISVKDRVPEDTETFIAYFAERNFSAVCIYAANQRQKLQSVYALNFEWDEVTHWMPLPKINYEELSKEKSQKESKIKTDLQIAKLVYKEISSVISKWENLSDIHVNCGWNGLVYVGDNSFQDWELV